jgi:hypothetical protein
MARAAYGQPLRNTLDNAEDKRT